jgi:ubiquinone/menaquinone biosynthesis C-methylase UbiE
MSLESLEPLRVRYGVKCSTEEFHSIVNVVFHDIESEVYDEVHRDMWESLPRQFELLTKDVLPFASKGPLNALDIGGGTGLSSQLLLATELGARVQNLTLLDTSARMLAKARERLRGSRIHVEFVEGMTQVLPSTAYDLILVSSVLHHIPDLEAFTQEVTRLQKPGGLFLHVQDPNADTVSEQRVPWRFRRFLPQNLARAAWRRLRGQHRKTYLDRVNDELLKRGVVERPMRPNDLWAITDIRIETEEGISVDRLAALLDGYCLLSKRTYAFFSVLASSLPETMRREEAQMIDAKAQDGAYVAAAWQLQRGRQPLE